MSDYLELKFDIFDETDQKASVLKSLTASDLIEEITGEFKELDPDTSGGYALYLEGTERPLDGSRALEEQGIQSGDKLIFTWARDPNRSGRKALSKKTSYSLLEETSQVIFPIEWQPALIGRPDVDNDHNELLAVNLQWLPEGRRVSHRHAQITEMKGGLYLERLAGNNPTYLNGKELDVGTRHKLKVKDTIRLGHSDIRLKVMKT